MKSIERYTSNGVKTKGFFWLFNILDLFVSLWIRIPNPEDPWIRIQKTPESGSETLDTLCPFAQSYAGTENMVIRVGYLSLSFCMNPYSGILDMDSWFLISNMKSF